MVRKMLFYLLSMFGLDSSSIWKILLVVITIGYILYKYSIRNFDYWKKRNVPYSKPLPFIGNFWEVFTFRATIGDFLNKIYKESKSPYFGIFALNKPCLVVNDLDLIKQIMVKDFHHFPDHTLVADESCDSVSSHFLLLAKGAEWKSLRIKVSPIFTSGKIKNMLPLINDCGNNLKIYLDKHANKDFLEAKELCGKYATDVITTCAFGINANCFEYEDAEFRVIGRKMFEIHWKTAMRQTFYFLTPGLVKLFKMPFLDRGVTDFLRKMFWETVESRQKNKIVRNDVIDTVNQIMAKSSSNDEIKFEGDTVVAAAVQFFSAGFETVSGTMAFALYELCLQPDIQNKLRAEIQTVISEHKGLTYEAVQDMKYLHMVICETLRKYPVLPFLDRLCIKDYKVPNSDLVIEKGTPIFLPMQGIQNDPEYFPDPEKFDPERFSEENKESFPSFSYLPFGEGPRNCIGERFGLVGTKLGLAHILSKYEVMRCKETPVPLVYEVMSFLLISTVGFPMKFKKVGLDDE